MLRLHRLELSGFKTFLDPVTVEFAGGVTAVVGPNGCGKSNLSDAVTWVLGEQSAKLLRGDSMEDVIFNGSESRKPLGMAEVTLTLLADPGTPGVEEGKILLSRRVFRSGESQYRLNGRLVRLKDFKDLLMDTGLGIRAYSVIEQGKIGMILSGKPQERRKLIEEAAGVTRYKARKRIAEIKLEEATANLLRLEDILAEVDRNLRSLKRQAGMARRYQEKQQEHRDLLRSALLARWAVTRAALAELGGRLDAETGAEAGMAAALHRDEAALAAGREALERLAEELGERHERQAELAALIEGRQEYLKAARQTERELTERAAAGAAVAGRRTGEIAEQERALAGLHERHGALAAEREQAAAAVAEDDLQIARAEEAAITAEGRLEDLRSQLLSSLAEVTGLRNELHREQIESEKGAYQQHQLGEQLSLFSEQIGESTRGLSEAQVRASQLGAAVESHQRDLTAAEERLEATQRRAADLLARQRACEEETTAARLRGELLADLSAAHAERRAALRESLERAGLSAPQFLADRIAAPAGWERSFDLYLGEVAESAILAPGDDGMGLVERLMESKEAGRLLRPVSDAPEVTLDVDDAAIVSALGEALGLDPQLARALPPAYLVESAADASRLARRHPGIAFISRDRLWAQGGLLHIQGDAAHPGLLARQREGAEIAARLSILESELTTLAASVESCLAERLQREIEATALRAELALLNQDLAVARARLEDATARHRRLNVEHETLTTEHAEVERELRRVAERGELLTTDLLRAEAHHKRLEGDFDRAHLEVNAARASREALRTAGAGRRGRLELLAERLAAHDRETTRLRQELDASRAQEGLWREEVAALTTRRGELAAGMERAQAELQQALTQRGDAQEAVLRAQEDLDRQRTEIRAIEEQVQALRGQREELRQRVEGLRVEDARLRQSAEHLTGAFVEEFQEAPPEAPEPQSVDLGELEVSLRSCKEALERLGPVNVLAAQEFTEQEERSAFLTAQRADIAASIESLRRTIREINQTSSERFLQTFNEVNRCFGETFAALFRGGEAEMRLMDEEDLLESGIEIIARPPGKRQQNIMLLSGGEKALTAIALLFSLFKTKPSPFCILDEVDAPLDDINTLRFVELLRQMTADTQFIVITHNKLTMEVASTLYGVTMEERGVSKVVSVSLEEVQPEERAVSA